MCSSNTPRNRPKTSWSRSPSTIADPKPAEIHVLPTLWFRNRWSWGEDNPRPLLQALPASDPWCRRTKPTWASAIFIATARPSLLFTENETNAQRLFSGQNRTPFVKDGINNFVVHGQTDAVNPQQTGTKAAAHYRLTVPPGKRETVRLRLTHRGAGRFGCDPTARADGAFGKHFDEVMRARRKEADEFYATVIPRSLDADAANVMRQALAGMLWSKQFFYFDVNRWLEERGSDPYRPRPKQRAAQRPVAPHVQRRHHLHAGQMGVSLVRRVGPRLPRPAAHAGGPGFRQAATRL